MSEMDTEQEKKSGGKGKLFALLAGVGAIFAVCARPQTHSARVRLRTCGALTRESRAHRRARWGRQSWQQPC